MRPAWAPTPPAAARRPRPLEPRCGARDPRRPGRRRRRVEVRDDGDGADRRRRAGRRAALRPAAGRPPARRVRSSAPSTPGGMRCAAVSRSSAWCVVDCRTSTRSTWAAASRSDRGRAVPSPARFAREIPAVLEDDPGGSPARTLGGRARPLPGRSRRLARRVGPPRARSRRDAARRPRHRDDGAHPPGALRRAPSHRGADVARHARRAAPPARTSPPPTRVDGPICESTDALGVHDLPPSQRGDLVAIADVGAYATVMSSTYNGRPRPPQVLLEPDGRLTLARRRGSVASLG